ncbi:DUF4992 family lipoprotein [uncultured Bacteroides sp.]|uniref:DUF4992 family lipoprotein n=1 Tax=uncultured Bacteroides sp. TaxID=162156 RepID=UPI002AAB90CE|nr:DUF4992 family lipoprotein [uncultured Bacteroides sp.]
MRNKFKIIGGICCLLILLLGVSCADGISDSERFSGGVINTQLESPNADGFSFTVLARTDGSEGVKMTWPVVYGAGGYLLNVTNVDSPLAPIVLVKDSFIDGCSVIFDTKEDTNYKISIKALGNEMLNNKTAESATTLAFSTLIPAVTIPEGRDIAEFIKANLQVSDTEQGFELQGGKTYTLNSVVDFGLNTITFRGDKFNRPIVIVGSEGGLMTQGGLKVKFINFDCTEMIQTGVLTLSDNPSETISTTALGYKEKAGANQDGYVIEKPVIFQDCNFKNVKNSILYGNKKNWSLRDFRINNCILQLNNSGSKPVINLYGGRNGLIKELTIKKSTFYNLSDNSSAYFIRYSNSSNAQPKKIFGKAEDSSTFTISYNTFCKTMNGKDFANNMANTKSLVFNVDHNIFYDTYRINKLLSSQAKRYTEGNTIFGVKKSVDSGDTGKKDTQGNPYAMLEDPNFSGPIDMAFDLSQPHGGVNFKTSAPVASENKSGDPRWSKE